MTDSHNPNINFSYRALRRILGQLGIALPFFLVIGMGRGFDLEPSISDYFYTKMGTVFTGILIAFGLFLFSYRGHEKVPGSKERISDNRLTNLAGILAVATALIPTRFLYKAPEACKYMLCPDAPYWGKIHLICAAGFLFIMGLTVLIKFTKGAPRPWMITYYKISGSVVIASLAFMAVYIFACLETSMGIKNGVFWAEVIALFAFGSAWLIKGRVDEMWISKKLFRKNS